MTDTSAQPLFRGVITALVTPFRNGEVDYAAFEKQALEVQRFRSSDHHHVARSTPITVIPAA